MAAEGRVGQALDGDPPLPAAGDRRQRVAAVRRRREWLLLILLSTIALTVAIGLFFALR